MNKMTTNHMTILIKFKRQVFLDVNNIFRAPNCPTYKSTRFYGINGSFVYESDFIHHFRTSRIGTSWPKYGNCIILESVIWNK